MTTRHWVDWVNVILGVWLVASPWLLTGTTADGPANWSLAGAGIGIVMLAVLAMRRPTVWGDTTGIVLGMWLIASPWVLGFVGATATTNAVIIGSLVIVYALWAARIDVTGGERC